MRQGASPLGQHAAVENTVVDPADEPDEIPRGYEEVIVHEGRYVPGRTPSKICILGSDMMSTEQVRVWGPGLLVYFGKHFWFNFE